MRRIVLDASGWREPDDFYDALFGALGAPAWHGRNFNALVDSIIWGDINAIEAPFTLRLTGLVAALESARQIAVEATQVLAEEGALLETFDNGDRSISVTQSRYDAATD